MDNDEEFFDGFTIAELEARYRAERDKRLRQDGSAQYRELAGAFADLNRDTFATPITRDPVTAETDVAIIGAGLGGLLAGARLAQQGVTDVRIIDKAGDVGGTWYWNRYPGARCDVESYIYLPMLEETGYIPTERYAEAVEIFEHCRRIARQYDLYSGALFQTEVDDLRWNEAASRWFVSTDRGDQISARFVIIAGGVLHKPKLPDTPGMDSFRGRSFHSSRWDYGYTGGSPTAPMDKLLDKRVALVGTGATAVQLTPHLAEAAGELLVVQRTPSGVGIRNNRPTDVAWFRSLPPGWQARRTENFTRVLTGMSFDEDLVADSWTEVFVRNPAASGIMNDEQKRADYRGMEAIRRRIDETVVDRATADALKPWYNQMCKRPCFHDEYLPTFNRPNVRLIDTDGRGIERITEDSLIVNGVSYPVDCIIYSSGFEAGTSYKRSMGFEIHGRDGVSFSRAWENGAATLHGIHARGFPNLLMFSVTQGGYAINFSHTLGELAIHAAWFIKHCLDEDVQEIEPADEAQEAWFQRLLSVLGSQAMFLSECTPSYMNGEGSRESTPAGLRSVPYFGGALGYIQILRDWRAAGGLPGMEIRRAKLSPAATSFHSEEVARLSPNIIR